MEKTKAQYKLRYIKTVQTESDLYAASWIPKSAAAPRLSPQNKSKHQTNDTRLKPKPNA